jgi:hypothetical protein
MVQVPSRLRSFARSDAAERQEAATTKRLDSIPPPGAPRLGLLAIAVETLAVFVRFWLATTPALPEPAAAAARAKAAERYQAFVTALGRRLAKGPKLHQEIAKDMRSATSTTSLEDP